MRVIYVLSMYSVAQIFPRVSVFQVLDYLAGRLEQLIQDFLGVPAELGERG